MFIMIRAEFSGHRMANKCILKWWNIRWEVLVRQPFAGFPYLLVKCQKYLVLRV